MPRKSARTLWAQHLAGNGSAMLSGRRSNTSIHPRVPFHGVVLGVDPSLRGTGLAVVAFEGRDSAQLLAGQVVRVHAKKSMPFCLATIFRAVSKALESWPIVHVAVEETIYVQNFQTAQRLGAARGAVLTATALRDLPVFEYPPLRIKQAVTGFGRASKEQMIRQVGSLLHLSKPLDSDTADAAAVALCHAATFSEAIFPRR